METTFAISRSVVDCVAYYEIEGGPVMARGVDGPRGDLLQCHGWSRRTKYSAVDDLGGEGGGYQYYVPLPPMAGNIGALTKGGCP